MKSCWLPQLKVKICEVCECAMCAWTIVQYNVCSYYSITKTRYNEQCQLNILKVWVSLSWWVHGVDNEVIITDQNVLLRCCLECSVSKYGQEAGASLMQETIQIYFGETKLVHCEISLSAVGTDPHLMGRGRPSQWFIELSTNFLVHRRTPLLLLMPSPC